MRLAALFFFALFCVSAAIAQDNGTKETDREALLKGLVSRDRGGITAIEASPADGGGVYIGYISGTVMNCYDGDNCKEFGGTPAAAVEQIAVSRRGSSPVVWVTYQHGALYRCVNGSCSKFIWEGAP